jgi:3'(2'), 5'-bisphosphate nucleotidase
MELFERELTVALDAAKRAGELIRKDYASFVAIPDAPATISTSTDRGAQELILQQLQAEFPHDALCAEEATETLAKAKRSGSRIWIVDPIDGTRGFAMKNGEFCVMIGLVADGELAVGVVLEPVSQRTTFARRGHGCWVSLGSTTPSPCHVSSTTKLYDAVLTQSHSKTPGQLTGPARKLQPGSVTETYSAGVKLALVARGEAELYVNTYLNFHDWDICAGHLLVTEAGGKVTTLKGEPIRYGRPNWEQHGGLLASNGILHELAIAGMGETTANKLKLPEEL